ncbi:M48 family metallopeptidase [Moraxella canis]|uniref:Peptidase M48 n=1 Tax=Moraxella canis TaxID=90239 RepID=A0A1S9ZPG4_9GAMM|nr:M48 family metallopeptidase [Moraxella canis]OOR85479.1 peptidase M48 [Moraxella canis]
MKRRLLAPLAISAALLGCVSTTTGTDINPERKQLLIYSNAEMQRMADNYYRQTLAESRSRGVLDSNTAQVNRVRTVASRLIPHVSLLRQDAAGWDWRVHVITDDTVNAYVMPNAKIVFYSGIIERLNLRDAEIAAIMGHEMAHALREHSREKISRRVATNATFGLATSLFGLGGSGVQALGLAGNLGLTLPHSRFQETEADKIGLELMARAGYNPQAAVTLWQKMEAMQANSDVIRVGFLSTHPTSTNRVKELQAMQGAVKPLYEAARQGR